MFESVTTVAMDSALSALSLRQRTIANNIANVNTPGFHAGRVAFEEALSKSVEAGSPEKTAASTANSLEPTRLNGSNVNMDTETLSNIDTVLRYQFAARSIEGTFTSVRTAMRTN